MLKQLQTGGDMNKFKNGDYVYDFANGWTTVTNEKLEGCGVPRVITKEGNSFLLDGKRNESDKNAILLTVEEAGRFGLSKPKTKKRVGKNVLLNIYNDGKAYVYYSEEDCKQSASMAKYFQDSKLEHVAVEGVLFYEIEE